MGALVSRTEPRCSQLGPQRIHIGPLMQPTGTPADPMHPLVQPTGNPADPYECPGATFWEFPTEQTLQKYTNLAPPGQGGPNFRWAGPSRPIRFRWCNQPTGAQRTHMGRLVQTTGTSANPYDPLVQPTGTIADPIWIRSGPIWVHWCNLPGPKRTHM